MSRTPDQRIYSSSSYAIYGFTQCYVSVGTQDGEDFAFQKCDADGRVTFTGMPTGDFKLTVFDQWNDVMLDGLVSPVKIDGGTTAKEFPVTQWRTDLSTRTYIDVNGDGLSTHDTSGVPCTAPNVPAGCNANYGNDTEPGLALVNTNIRYRDGSFGFFNNTDLHGYAGFNEVFPFMNWLVVETTSTRYKQTGIHSVYDTGGPADRSTLANSTPCVGSAVSPCGNSNLAAMVSNTFEKVSLPPNQRVPGAVYCGTAATADCTGKSIQVPAGSDAGTCTTNLDGTTTCTGLSAGRIDPPQPWGPTEAWQGLLGQTSYIDFGMKPFAAGENGGINGHVIYASTRPFDDPSLLLQLSWEPGVPRVKLNLYKETVDAFGNQQLQLVDTTTTTSWDDWAQGFRAAGVPNMNCPGQDHSSPFFQTLKDSKQWLDPAIPKTALTNHSLFKCYDGWSQLNQVQPAPYDGMYKFPSVTGRDPVTGKPLAGALGTNCTACTPKPADPSMTNDYLAGSPMLAPGKYVVEVIVPEGFELVKEEDKNILLGDVYIAPVTQQFAGFGNVFIMPDQAAVNAYYNPQSPGSLNLTTNLGATPRHEGDTGSVEAFWPCVGTQRIVPDLNSLFPGAGQAAPFAGATRRLCDRKEVTLEDQASVLAKFYVFSSTHIAGHFTGTMTNDFASEFDPFSPQFGEKFGPPNLPVGMRDFAGNEVARVYADQWGLYNGLYFSTYSVNPPNPTGYVPQMSIACMNDPGPILDSRVGSPTNGLMITDPAYSPAYSNFCYETAFMPGFTAYMDTPVIPTQAFADGYNLPDSEYPDLTPAIKSVTGNSGVAGPWVSASGATLTITALGDKVVQNNNFTGPNAATAPYNQKTITRHYGFCPATGPCTAGTVTIAGVPATCTWGDPVITCTVPTIPDTLSAGGVGSTCYSGTNATPPAGQTPPQRGTTTAQRTPYRCGQLVITAANGKKSIDAITVTVAGRPPTVVTPASASSTLFGNTYPNPLQNAIDNAAPGDLIIVAPGTYRENLLMWKPVRLQGVGAGSVTINADAHPAGKLDSWRRQVVCLFGLSVAGVPNPGNAAFDPTGTYTCPAQMFLRSDRIPFEAIVGWDAAGNGNLAQVLQEPTLMGAYEGAGISVLGRGILIPTTSTDFWGQGTPGVPGAFPNGSRYLRDTTSDCTTSTALTPRDYGTANYQCNPSRVDGVSVINSSQGGGAIFMHGWNHYLEIANTRIFGNHGTLTGGINLGNGETPPLYTNDGAICGAGAPALCPPFPNTLIGTVLSTFVPNAAIPFQLNVKSHVHHNMIVNNASIGDALFSGTPSGAGGITVSAGADAYTIDHNWVAGNLSTGDAGGIQHTGVSFNGLIQNNWILFNQTTNPTLPTNGGGLSVTGANSDRVLANGLECGSVVDTDCPPGIGDGIGHGNVIDANLILGNSAESGSGGGLRLQQINGSEVGTFPAGAIGPLEFNLLWYGIAVTNNVIVNNVAGWDGGGVSMQDALKVSFVNNTVASNDTTASAGVLFKTLGAINSSAPPPGCIPTPNPLDPQNPLCLIPNASHDPQAAGLVTQENTPNLNESLPANVLCPPGFNYGNAADSQASRLNGACRTVSLPALKNDMFWQNRAFRVDIVTPSLDPLLSQQNIVALTPLLNQTITGQCTAGANYWDVGVRGDAGPTIHSSGVTLTLSNSIVTNTSGVAGPNNVQPGGSPVIAQFCNGSRTPPENCTNSLDPATCGRYNAPPGRSETTGLTPLFLFNNITPAATVDEGHNWLNLTYGPLTLSRAVNVVPTIAPELMVANQTTGTAGGAYSIAGTSAAVNRGFVGIPFFNPLPATAARDYFGNARTINTGFAANPPDIGAVEFPVPSGSTLVVVNPAPLAFGNVVVSTTTTRDLTVSNNGTTPIVFINTGTVTGTGGALFSRVTVGVPGNCAVGLLAGASCTIRVQYIAPASPTSTPTGSVAITRVGGAVVNAPVALSANVVAATFLASVSPSPLAFGNWATTTTSPTQNLTVTNTGNSALTAIGLTGIAAPYTRVTTGTFPNGAPSCALVTVLAPLAPGAPCTIKVQYAPTAVGATTQNVTVTTTPAATVTPTPVVLTGTGVAVRAAAAIVPNPKTITLITGTVTDVGVVTLVNNAPLGTGAQMTVSSVTVTGGTFGTYFFNKQAGQDNCTGATVAPGGFCTVGVRFTNTGSPRGVNRFGTIIFTDSGAGSPQGVPNNLIGFATP